MLRASLLIAAILVAASAEASGIDWQRLAVVPRAEGFYGEAVLHVPVPPALAWEVMTDFEAMPRFVPNLRSSSVLQREGRVMHVEQVGIAAFGPFSFDFTMVRRLELEAPSAILGEQVRGTLERYRSALRLDPEKGGTRMTYRAQIDPGLVLGTILSKEFIEHEIRRQFTALAAEMVRRSAVPPPTH